MILAFGIDPAAILKNIRGAVPLLKTLYPGVTNEQELGRQVARDLVFTLPVRSIVDRHSKRAPTFRYYFEYVSVNARPQFPHGVPHGAEIIYVLDTIAEATSTKIRFTPHDRAYARAISDYFLHFASTGRPFSTGQPQWLSSTTNQDRTLLFSDPITPKQNFLRPRLNAFLAAGKLLAPFLTPR